MLNCDLNRLRALMEVYTGIKVKAALSVLSGSSHISDYEVVIGPQMLQ